MSRAAALAGRSADAGELDDRALALARQADDPNGPLLVGIQLERSLFAQRFGEIDRARIVADDVQAPDHRGLQPAHELRADMLEG